MSVIVTDGAGDRYEVVDYDATFTLRSLDRPNSILKVGTATLRDLGIEWDGRALRPAPASSRKQKQEG